MGSASLSSFALQGTWDPAALPGVPHALPPQSSEPQGSLFLAQLDNGMPMVRQSLEVNKLRKPCRTSQPGRTGPSAAGRRGPGLPRPILPAWRERNVKLTIVSGEGLGSSHACPNLVWILCAGRFHDRSSGDFASTFIKAGDSGTKQGLKIEESRSQ